jgi:hypothetical protein
MCADEVCLGYDPTVTLGHDGRVKTITVEGLQNRATYDGVTNHPCDLQLSLLTYANNPLPPFADLVLKYPMPNTITPRNTKAPIVPRLVKTPSPRPDIAYSQ